MLCVNNIDSIQQTGFKSDDRRYVAKMGRKSIDSDAYVRQIDVDIFNMSRQDPTIKIAKTANFAEAQLAQFSLKTEQNIYAGVIKKCFADIDNAIINKLPESQVSKLTEVLELFIKKYGHLAK